MLYKSFGDFQNNFNTNNNFENELDDWGHFVYIDDNTHYNNNNPIFHSSIKKYNSKYKLSGTPLSDVPLSDVPPLVIIPKNNKYNFKQEDKIIRFYEEIYNCVVGTFITISIIYFITKL